MLRTSIFEKYSVLFKKLLFLFISTETYWKVTFRNSFAGPSLRIYPPYAVTMETHLLKQLVQWIKSAGSHSFQVELTLASSHNRRSWGRPCNPSPLYSLVLGAKAVWKACIRLLVGWHDHYARHVTRAAQDAPLEKPRYLRRGIRATHVGSMAAVVPRE